MMKPEHGTYALIFRCRSETKQQVGQWGMIQLRKGYYVYVGSAFGPGGVLARVSHHCRAANKPHWHIDYLSDYLNPVVVWYTHDHRRLEHRWAGVFSQTKDMTSFQGFGCTDCDCHSHLFFTLNEPRPAMLLKSLINNPPLAFQAVLVKKPMPNLS